MNYETLRFLRLPLFADAIIVLNRSQTRMI